MIWTLIFFLSISQGLFLISVILFRKFNNMQACYFIISIIGVIIVINADFLITTSGIYKIFTNLHGFSFGTMFIMSPLFYWYTKSILDENYVWQRKNLLHFIPYFLKCFHTYTFFNMANGQKVKDITAFLNDKLIIETNSYISLTLQILHLAIYLYFTKKAINESTKFDQNTTYLITFEKRVKWLNTLFYCFLAYFISFTFWFVIVAIKGAYIANAEYTNVILMSIIIYFLAYKSYLEPDLVIPNFIRKYKSQAQISIENGLELEQKLKYLMEKEQLYLNPDLTIDELAKALDIPSYLCSRFINDKYEIGFFDFLNTYRIEKIKDRLVDRNYQHFSILGIALQTGFNSKSSFNTAFRKITGTTPSEYKKEASVAYVYQ